MSSNITFCRFFLHETYPWCTQSGWLHFPSENEDVVVYAEPVRKKKDPRLWQAEEVDRPRDLHRNVGRRFALGAHMPHSPMDHVGTSEIESKKNRMRFLEIFTTQKTLNFTYLVNSVGIRIQRIKVACSFFEMYRKL